MKEKNTRCVQVTMTEDLYRKFSILAKIKSQKMTAILRNAILEYVKKYQEELP